MYLSDPRFSFLSMNHPGGTFAVISFTCEEAISSLYVLNVTLVSATKDVDFAEIIDNPASLIIHGQDGDIPIHGICSQFEQQREIGEYAVYAATVVPKLWWLTLIRHNQVFLDKSTPQILEQILRDGGLSDRDYEFKLQGSYPEWEFVVQYNETLYDFLSRWMEREGIYFYFRHGKNSTKIVITDTKVSHEDIPLNNTVLYSPPSGLDHDKEREVAGNLVWRQRQVPEQVKLKDYNYETPSLQIIGTRSIADSGRGSTYKYGDYIRTPSEGKRLAKIRAEEYRAWAGGLEVSSTVPQIRSGFLFKLKHHYRQSYNRNYLVVSCFHKGNQASYLTSGIQEHLQGAETEMVYENTFTAIDADTQFRSRRVTPKPRISGSLNAVIDAEGSGEYAELDGQGRYKVILPFDTSGRKEGHASCWLRMLQPYTGDNHGMHFPLHKGAEVLLTFIEGDPDRPIISGAVPNPEHPSQVTNQSQTMCKITTGGQNKIHMEDKDGSQRILMSSPTSGTWMRMGAPNDPPAASIGVTEGDEDDSGWGDVEHNKDGFRISTEGNWYGVIGEHMSVEVGGNSTKMVVGGEEIIIMGFDNKTVEGTKTDITLGLEFSWLEAGSISLKLVKELSICGGTEYEIGEIEKVELRPSKTKVHAETNDVSESKNEISEEATAIGMAFTAINEMNTRLHAMEESLAEAKTSIVESETKLREDINKVLSEELGVIENSIQMLVDNVEIGDDDLMTFFTSTEITEKTFL